MTAERAPTKGEKSRRSVDASGTNLLATGLYSTRTGVLGERLLEEHGQALQAYLCIRTGDARRAAAAYDDLVVWLNRQKKAALEAGPSLRAVICRAARVVGGSASDTDDYQPRELDSVPWEPAPIGSVEGYGRVLDHVRRNLRTGEAELLALRYSHDLDVAELAYVFDESEEIVERHVRTAMAWADLLVTESSGGFRIETAAAVRDAFRVIPSAVLQFSTANAPRPPRLAAGTRVGDRYEIDACIGGGEFAWVYKAFDVHVPGHSVALKILHRPSRTAVTREGAIRELGLIASAFHPSLVQFKDYGWFCERLWFVMPWYEGETLAQRIERGSLPLDEALSIFVPLARGLSALHGAGVIHHDVKPENILLAELRGESGARTGEILPVLLDLGVAAPEGELSLAGTPMYFAPEAAERIVCADPTLPLTPKADVFALALSLVHAVVGPPNAGEKDIDTFLAERFAHGLRLPRASALRPVRRVLTRALAHDPASRPTSAEFAAALLDRSPRRKGRLGWALGAALGSVGTAALLFALGVLPGHGRLPTAGAGPSVDPAAAIRTRLARQEARAERLEKELAAARRASLDPPPSAPAAP